MFTLDDNYYEQGRIQDSAKVGAMVNSRAKIFRPRPLISRKWPFFGFVE